MPVNFKDYYAVLGVPRGASDDEIRNAFRKLARQHHPDVAKDKKAAEEKFKEINEAHEVLSDPEKRRKYDQLGAGWREDAGSEPPPGWQERAGRSARGAENAEFHFGGTGFSDFFEQFFGGGGRYGAGFQESGFNGASFGQRAGAMRGGDVEGDLLVTLNEVMHGSVRTVSLERTDPRTGRTIRQTFKVRIPAGVQEGQIIRVPGKGDEGAGGGQAGDLYLRVRLAAHPDFTIRGADLYYELQLAPWEAVLGTTVSVPTADSRASVKVPPGTDTGQKLRLRRRGLPIGGSGQHGDLYVVVSVHVPRQINDEERRLWEQLQRGSRFNPRPP